MNFWKIITWPLMLLDSHGFELFASEVVGFQTVLQYSTLGRTCSTKTFVSVLLIDMFGFWLFF